MKKKSSAYNVQLFMLPCTRVLSMATKKFETERSSSFIFFEDLDEAELILKNLG